MSEEIKEKCDRLIDEFLLYMSNLNDINGATHLVILSTENTIKVLEKAKSKIDLDYKYDIANIIDEQNEILKELESRL